MGKQPLLQIMPTVLVGSTIQDKANFMTVSMSTIVSSSPSIIVVAITPLRKSYTSIKENGVFSVNIPSTDMIKVTDYCGMVSGRKKDKSREFEVFYGDLEKAPMIRACKTNLECKLLEIVKTGNHDLFIGEIVESYVDMDCVSKNGKVDINKIDPLIFNLDGMNYWSLGSPLGKAMSIGKEYLT